jgi:DNA primase
MFRTIKYGEYKMAKISPVSIKYMVHANFIAEGALEKPDVIGAIFGQTEGLLGNELEMRELQKEGKIGRIEVELKREGKKTTGVINIPTALDQSETTLIAAAIETIERIGPSDAQIEVERIEDVRGSKRDYIIERAKKLMMGIEGKADSREISQQLKTSARTSAITEYGDEKLPAGDLSHKEIIVVEGRADVINLLKNGVNNVVGMSGTKLPDGIKKLGEEKDLILFLDGDRGGKLIARNVVDNVKVKSIAIAPDGKEVEELTGKEILMCLRKQISVNEFFGKKDFKKSYKKSDTTSAPVKEVVESESPREISSEDKEKIKELSQKNSKSGKAILLNSSLEEIKTVAAKALGNTLRKGSFKLFAIIIDGTVTNPVIKSAEEAGCKIISANNFATTDTNIELLSY